MQLVREEQRQKYARSDRGEEAATAPDLRITQEEVLSCWQEIAQVHVAPTVEAYIVNLVGMTRHPQGVSDELASYISLGVSPRGTLALERCGRANAWLAGRDAVLPQDIKDVAHAVLRHRLMMSYQANADGFSANDAIQTLLDTVVA